MYGLMLAPGVGNGEFGLTRYYRSFRECCYTWVAASATTLRYSICEPKFHNIHRSELTLMENIESMYGLIPYLDKVKR